MFIIVTIISFTISEKNQELLTEYQDCKNVLRFWNICDMCVTDFIIFYIPYYPIMISSTILKTKIAGFFISGE